MVDGRFAPAPVVGLLAGKVVGREARVPVDGRETLLPEEGRVDGRLTLEPVMGLRLEELREEELRELEEETGITADKVEVVAPASAPMRYDLPPELLGRVWKGKYRGQIQHWYLGRFLGSEADIDLAAHAPPEFQAYRWVEPAELPALIVPFKRAVYEALVEEFAALI